MSYEQSFEAAGAKVLAIEYFGSYQGTFVAHVEYQGKRGWIVSEYGSCSGCDAFESEFSWSKEQSPENLAAFGKEYLDDLWTDDEILGKVAKHSDYSVEDGEMLKWVEKQIAGSS
jgi:hypothetical protein